MTAPTKSSPWETWRPRLPPHHELTSLPFLPNCDIGLSALEQFDTTSRLVGLPAVGLGKMEDLDGSFDSYLIALREAADRKGLEASTLRLPQRSSAFFDLSQTWEEITFGVLYEGSDHHFVLTRAGNCPPCFRDSSNLAVALVAGLGDDVLGRHRAWWERAHCTPDAKTLRNTRELLEGVDLLQSEIDAMLRPLETHISNQLKKS